jgi:hypothetical protein
MRTKQTATKTTIRHDFNASNILEIMSNMSVSEELSGSELMMAQNEELMTPNEELMTPNEELNGISQTSLFSCTTCSPPAHRKRPNITGELAKNVNVYFNLVGVELGKTIEYIDGKLLNESIY